MSFQYKTSQASIYISGKMFPKINLTFFTNDKGNEIVMTPMQAEELSTMLKNASLKARGFQHD